MPMTAVRPSTHLYLRLPALAENVVVVRRMLRGLDDLLAPRPGLSNCVQTAVSEAANNVVMHAYDGAAGPLEVEVSLAGPLEIRIRDHGVGFAADLAGDDAALAFGRSVIEGFADEVSFIAPPSGGTEVRLRWETPRLLGAQAGVDPQREGDTLLALVADAALGNSLSCVLAAVGARACIDVDGLADLRLIGEALLAAAPANLAHAQLSLAFSASRNGLGVRVGPFATGGAATARSATSIEGFSLIERLSDATRIEADPLTGSESLTLSLARPDGSAAPAAYC